MEISLFVLAVGLMFSGAQGISESMSCSMVNGQMICNKETSPGNVAMSGSSAITGGGFSSMDTMARAGNQMSSQSVRGGNSASGSNYGSPNMAFTSSQSSSGSPNMAFTGSQTSSGFPNMAFTSSQTSNVGGGSAAGAGGMSFSYVGGSGTPGAAVGGMNFVGAGMPFMFPGMGGSTSGSSAGTAAVAGSGSSSGPVSPFMTGPMNFVNQMMGGMFGGGGMGGVGAFAGGGFFPMRR